MIKTDPNLLVDPKFIGIPYKIGSRTFEAADCIGVCLQWMESQGLHYDYDDGEGKNFEQWWEKSPRRFLDAVLKHGTFIKLSEVRRFDVLLFILGNEGNAFPSCMGVMIDERHFLISTKDRGSFVAMMDTWWKERHWGSIRLYKAIEKYESENP